ncbi:MAG TPA: hypothetical protein VGM05_28490 [Planctomycetaceae bacterium]|jgi:hypothetical protein
MQMDDPLDYVDFADILQHADPGKWKFKGPKSGTPTPATSPTAESGTMKHYDLCEDEFGVLIEVHFFRRSDGSVDDVKIK